jgi:hypothetical protein
MGQANFPPVMTMKTRTMSMNSKTNKATAAQAGVLQEFDRLHAVLTETHREIPALLAQERTIGHELGLAEGRGESGDGLRVQLEDVAQQRQAAIRRRAASIAAIVGMEPALQGERAAMERQRQEYAAEAVRAFGERYKAAVAALQGLWEEGRILAATLRTEVPMPLPVRVTTSPVDGSTRAVPVRSGDAAAVDAEAARLGAQLDQVDEALALCHAIRQGEELERRHHRLAMDRGAATQCGGVYKVILQFRCMLDGLEFEPGQLVDHTLIGSGMMHRLMTGRRHIEPVGLESAAA